MSQPRLFLCGGVDIDAEDPRRKQRLPKELRLSGPDANINFVVEDLCRRFDDDVTERLIDLIEIAAYIYVADCTTERGTAGVDTEGKQTWSREFEFVIPVQDLAFWSSERVHTQLARLLSRLSNDRFVFHFVAGGSRERQQILLYGENADWPFRKPDRVLLFSGGLDSLAGAVETARRGENLVLVSHRSTPSILKRQRDLLAQLQAAYPNIQILHVPVALTLKKRIRNSEPTQRTRSFLFASLAAVVASSTEAQGIRFFENGVVSVNLPVADEVLGSRASRTTHPRTLSDFQQFLGWVLEADLVIDNPFFANTKRDIVKKIADSKVPELIGLSRSCALARFATRSSWHCGACSQCVDRRMAVIAADAEIYDPESDYEIDVFTGPRKEGYNQNIALAYVRLAQDLHSLGPDRIAERYADEIFEANRALSNTRDSAQQLCELMAEHGKIVSDVVAGQIRKHADRFMKGDLQPSCLLRLIAGNHHGKAEWGRFADSIVKCLRDGLPAACNGKPPKNENDLQCLCDGLLKAAGEKLQREFPFARWGIIGTKPDWSKEEVNLWVELKFARKSSATPGRISDEIATDITKYGDNKKCVLFVVFDPDRLITDDASFVLPITSHDGMRATVIR